MTASDKQGQPSADTAQEQASPKDVQPVKSDEEHKGLGRPAKMLAVLILSSLVWYILSDRYTPYTTQARIQGYVIGVAPEVAGNITQVWVNNNSEVQQGERLFQIDPELYEIALARATNELANARTQVEAGNAAVVSARANLSAAQANELRARQDFERLERLRETDEGTISLRRLESSRASLDQAVAKVAAAKSDIQRAIQQKGGDDEASNAILLSAQNAVEKAELDLANTLVRAPSRGLITDLRADVGAYAGTGKPVMTLIAIHDLWVNADFTENNLGHLAAGTAAEITFDSMPGQVFPARIRSLGLGVSAGQAPAPGTLPSVSNSRDWLRQSQRFPVEVDFSEVDAAQLKNLRIGGQVSVMAYSDKATVLRWLGKAYIRAMAWLSYLY
ncbi:MAG: HlyD family secretion protein [Pseudomonadota bacterium]